ncbi:lipid A export permease/ATP-binding protein MsbA [Laribacter hongkongensis]|uniref:Lipid A export ATP-binding/permease protein MsbA n=1 Tax=Laribacter hongkongensis TaxID=168471 RepID=A0A248LNC7_9NEIS|nr:lipid A export permease/ATP-binding protein MsbA [Laribacter hongkongensis]ASJ25954.1 lipid A export ATP-binding/permease protein MsbA [Laribacter hongkongensis]MCG9040017.1 lipid A export permease/ATP-binding protein MsbA [Laribacter hongkongensis]MCG9068308.1 lipid A export permease/ATP-binding protein MsbA [Laribacter hongkongensis]MCG9098668.1 lipid A export permease/ATP-binding protein MsbA [Laribacter hongkongensis]MCG9109641.1 lipid A export permease/ATP-binding protein MsbA [Laribac
MTQPTKASSWALYKRLAGYLRHDWKVFSVSIIAMVIASATEPLFASLMKPLINEGFVNRNPHELLWTSMSIVGLFVVRALASFGNDYSTTWLASRLVVRLREAMFAKLLRLPVSYYDNNASGRLISRLSNDVNQVSDAGFNVITVSVRDGVTIAGLLGLLFWTDWRLTLICLIMIPVVGIGIRLVGRRLRKLSHINQHEMGQMMQVLGEAVDGQRVVKVYGGQEFEQSRFMRAAHGLRRNLVKQVSASSMNTGVTQLIVSVALAVIIYSAGLRAAEGSFSAGDFMSYLTAMIMLFTPVKRITTVTQILQRGLAAAESVFTLLDSPEETNQGRQTLTRAQGELRFEQVGFRYPQGEREALEHITLHIRPGETVALVGGSGSGKTTLANLVPRFYDPQSGRITLDGIPLPELELGNLRQQVAMVNQDVVLFNGTLADNIAYARPGASREEIVEAARAANAMEFISTLPEGFDTLIGENGTRLSGGQRQRIAIARALIKDAPILILDEATSALDTQSERLVQAALDELMKHRTTLVIAHRLSTIEKADRIVVMRDGRIVEEGAHEVLLRQEGIYAQLHRLQFHTETALANQQQDQA